jgi:cardiolipin synthase
MSVGAAVGAALTSRRTLGPAETNVLWVVGAIAIALAAIALLWPWVLAYPLAVIAVWVGVVALMRALRMRRQRRGRAEAARAV